MTDKLVYKVQVLLSYHTYKKYTSIRMCIFYGADNRTVTLFKGVPLIAPFISKLLFLINLRP